MKKHLFLAAMAALLAFPAIGPAMAETPEAIVASEAQQSAEDRVTLIDSRVAALKTGLKLKPAQEKDWAALEAVLREVAKQRVERKAEARQIAKDLLDKEEVVEGLKLGAKLLRQRSEDLAKVADAAAPLFATFDEAQKHRFALLLHTFSGRSAAE
jgi:hypothetical protein